MFGLGRVRWALRKVALPVSGNALVLDVGSGGKPYPRSDVLLDRMTGAAHRCGQAMMIDRPAVLGDATRMPFKDKAFDFVVASHVLEHMSDPQTFLVELSRVGKAGYIETPNALFERLFPYSIHCLEVASIDGRLWLHKKRAEVEDSFLGKLGMLQRDRQWRALFHRSPHLFHVRHFWSGSIDFEIHNPDTNCEWIERVNANSETGEVKDSYATEYMGWREMGLNTLGLWNRFRRHRRLNGFRLLSILACPGCLADLEEDGEWLRCVGCHSKYRGLPYPDFTQVVV